MTKWFAVLASILHQRPQIIYLNLVVIYNHIGHVKNDLQYWSPFYIKGFNHIPKPCCNLQPHRLCQK